MDPFGPELLLKKEVRFSESLAEANPNLEENFGDVFGGIIKSGQWAWLTKGSHLRITSLRTGQLISKFEFDDSNGFGVCIITCVSEIQLPYLSDSIIAIGIQYADCPGGLCVIYSVEESTVIRCIELKHKITCSKFISQEVSQHTVLQNMNGCLAIGTDSGSVLLVDLNLRGDEMNASVAETGVSVVPCHIVDYSMSLLHLHRHFQHCQQEGVHFGIQLEVLDNAKFIQSLLPIDLILSLAVGLADGRLVLYDLTDMQVFYVAPPQERSSPLVKMNFMEPPDDPRSCVYIWAFHENFQNSMAVMHSLMYEKRVVADDGFCYFENFQVSCVRLLLPLNCAKSVPITCQAITKAPSHGNEETISLCALVWKQDDEVQTEVLLFDINQWYKEEMPYVGDWREEPSYLASFVYKGLSSLEMYFNPNTISLFNSIQRPEEHFYPVSLSFDTIALGENSCVHLNWPGAQNRVINVLRSKGSLALLDPNPLFTEILNTRLLPQFSGMNYKSTFSLKAKRETLLSVAIEQNCIGLLKECAKNWSDGSHQGKSLIEGLSMSTLTDWLWTRASSIKERCNTLGQVLFNHSGCTLDQREQKELGYISRQLKTLSDILSEIIAKFGESIPSDVLTTLESQGKSIQMASDYQEILLWLLNIGLLPEASRTTRHREVELNLVPYPYESLRTFYEDRRAEFTGPYDKFSSRKTRSCYLLFIDSFIEHEFKSNSLRDSWQESGGDGLYPPTSIQSMLRIMLIPEVTFENKCALFLYFFLDLNMAIEDKRYEAIVQNFIKFPSVFKLSASLIKQIQAFWNLDHCRFQAAVDEFISPFNKDQVCPQWQLELFLESLLAQNEPNLALRVLEAKPSPTSPVLQLNTYLANDLISEAFHFARSKQDEDLLKLFFTTCLCTGKFGVIRDLALTESEGNLVQSLLKNSKSRNAENLHFVYLLQKYKYIEAVSYLDELSKGRVIQRAVDVDTPTLVLSAYNTTMTPVTKGLSDVYFKIKNKIKSKEAERSSPYPLSCQLIKQNANDLLGGIYHSSALSAHFASHYWERHQSEGNTLQQSVNAPFLRRPQLPSSYSDYNQQESISYPDPYKAAQKRRLDNSSAEEERSSKDRRENPKKRRKIYDRSDVDSIYKPLSREQPTADNLLTHFKNVSTHSQDMTNYTRKLQKTPPKDMSFFLETPYVKNTVANALPSETIRRVPEKPGTSLQGILKVSQSNPKSFTESRRARSVSVESEKRERQDVEEEKSIRFILPSVEDESEEQIDDHDVEMESDDEKQLREEIPQSLSRYVGPAKRKSLRSYSSYMSSARVVHSRSPPLKKSGDENSPEEPPSKLSAVAVHTTEIKEPDDHQAVNVRVHPIGPRTTLQTVRIEDSQNQNFATALTSTIEHASDEDSEEESVSETNQHSIVATESANVENVRAADSEKQPSWNMRISSRRAVGSRPSLRAVETEQKASFVTPVRATEPKWLLRTDDSEEQTPFSGIDTTDRVRNIPIVLLDENYHSETQPESAPEPENIHAETHKTPKRPLSVSSEERTNDSTHFVQQRAKQLKGRGSIHSSFSDITDHNVSTAPELETQTKPKTDTIIDFQPQGSSSRVCATESKFNLENRESVNVSESDSKFHSEKVTSKITFSERSTVVGGLTYMPTIETTEQVTDTVSVTIQPRDQMLDTTVDMTLYDTLGFDQSHQKLPSVTSNSPNSSSENRNQQDDSNISPFDEPSDESGSVILLSSRSSSRTYYEDHSENSENGAQEPKTKEIVIDDEDDDDDSDDDIDILDSDVSEEHSNSFSNQFDEVSVTRTSTSCSLPSNTDTVLSSAAEIETEAIALRRPVRKVEDGDETSNENDTFATVNVQPIDEEEIEGPATISDKRETTETTTILVSEENKDNIETEPKGVRLIDVTEESQPDEINAVEEEKEKELENTAYEDAEEEQITETQKTTLKGGQNEDAKNEAEKSEAKEDKNDKLDSDTMLEKSAMEGQSEERVENQVTEEELTLNPRRKRSQSFSKTTITTATDVAASPSSSLRHSRSGSMPPSSGHQIVTRRKSMLLESLNENATPDSPSSRTRSKIRSDSIDGDVDSPSVSNIKRTRLSSVSSVTSTEQAQTPKSRRRSSMSVDKDVGSTPKVVVTPRATRAKSITTEVITTPIKTPRRLSVTRKNDSPTDETSLVGTPRATRARSITSEVTTTPKRTPRRLSVSKKNDSPTDQTNLVTTSKGESHQEVIENPETESGISQSDDYKSSRRLTRTQLAVLEKSSALAAQIAISPVRVTRRRPSRSNEKESPSNADVKESDTESISSQVSHLSGSTSSRRVTRSSALKDTPEDDVISVASSTESGRRRRKRMKEATSPNVTLTVIPEEDPSGSEGSVANSQTSKRSRRQKK